MKNCRVYVGVSRTDQVRMSDGLSRHREPLTKHTAHPAWIQLAIAKRNPTPWIKVSFSGVSEILSLPLVAGPRHHSNTPGMRPRLTIDSPW